MKFQAPPIQGSLLVGKKEGDSVVVPELLHRIKPVNSFKKFENLNIVGKDSCFSVRNGPCFTCAKALADFAIGTQDWLRPPHNCSVIGYFGHMTSTWPLTSFHCWQLLEIGFRDYELILAAFKINKNDSTYRVSYCNLSVLSDSADIFQSSYCIG